MRIALVTCLVLVAKLSNAVFQCPLKADIVFVLDGSDSVISKEWLVFKESVITMLSSYPIDSATGVAVGCVVFASQVDDTIPLRPYLDSNSLTNRIRQLKASRTGTGTSKGLHRMRQLFNTQGRLGTPRIGILIVDGNSRDMVQAETEALRAKAEGTLLLVVGVGNDFEDKGEIRRLASRPDLAFEALDFFALRDISSFLSQRFCEEIRIEVRVPPTTPPTTTTTTTTPAPTTTTTTPAPTTTTTTTPAPTTTTLAPTTTTLAPTTTTTPPPPPPTRPPPTLPPIPTPQLPPGYDPCDGCRITNGIGYNSHPTDCSMYVQCLFPFGVAVPNYRTCSGGTFWDQDALTCRLPLYVQCDADPCRKQGFSGYPSGYPYYNNCRTYWSCSGRRTVARACCPLGQRYTESVGCIPDTSCTDTCLEDSVVGATTLVPTLPPDCRYEADPTNAARYIERWGVQTFTRDCAPGTEFSVTTCRCEAALARSVVVTERACSPEIKVTFANGIQDSSGNEFTIGVRGVRAVRANGTVDGYAGYFDGQSRLLMYRFDNAYFSNQVAIYIRYKEGQSSGLLSRDEALVANSDCGITPSVKVGFNRATNILFGTVNVGSDSSSQVPYARDDWKEVKYIYDGNSLDVSCASPSMVRKDTTPVTGSIARKQCALHVGYGQNMAPFVGWIDEIRVYLCIPTQMP